MPLAPQDKCSLTTTHARAWPIFSIKKKLAQKWLSFAYKSSFKSVCHVNQGLISNPELGYFDTS